MPNRLNILTRVDPIKNRARLLGFFGQRASSVGIELKKLPGK